MQKITVIRKEENSTINFDVEEYKNKSLLQLLQDYNIGVQNICRGNGTCGKCKVTFLNTNAYISSSDRNVLSKAEIEQGIRLACKYKIQDLCKENKDNILIEVMEETEDNILVEKVEANKIHKSKGIDYTDKKIDQTDEEMHKAEDNKRDSFQESYFLAIDIGTTTIAMALVDEVSGEVCDTYVSLNHQRKFGSDVISRILASNEGKGQVLKQSIEEDLWNGFCNLLLPELVNGSLKEQHTSKEKNIGNGFRNITKIYIAGNTTMIHLLMGYSCETLGKAPYSSEHLAKIECIWGKCITNIKIYLQEMQDKVGGIQEIPNNSEEIKNRIYENVSNIPVTILPGISAFVGGDVVAGLLVCPKFETEEISLLIDLGTNGEMVLGNCERLFASSASAGPAFEGGNIVCGMACVPGSISQVKIENRRAVIKTIQNEMPPKGICGTGVVSVISQLKQNKLMDCDGVLSYPYDRDGFTLGTSQNGKKVALYQQDIRQFQMAKSAIRVGISILMQEYGCEMDEIKNVYLAGGMGVHLQEEDAIETGLLPREFQGKIIFMGNSALLGAIKAGNVEMRNTGLIEEKINSILQRVSNISLSENNKFQELYLKYMEF